MKKPKECGLVSIEIKIVVNLCGSNVKNGKPFFVASPFFPNGKD
jgi:hypothetical protein